MCIHSKKRYETYIFLQPDRIHVLPSEKLHILLKVTNGIASIFLQFFLDNQKWCGSVSYRCYVTPIYKCKQYRVG